MAGIPGIMASRLEREVERIFLPLAVLLTRALDELFCPFLLFCEPILPPICGYPTVLCYGYPVALPALFVVMTICCTFLPV